MELVCVCVALGLVIDTSLPLQSKTSQPTSLKQQLPQGGAVSQGGQSSGQSRGVEGGGEKAVQEMPSTEAGGCG